MKAMVLNKLVPLLENPDPLELMNVPAPIPGDRELLLKVAACGVCHTELDEIEGRTPPPSLPLIPGHQVVGFIEQVGKKGHPVKSRRAGRSRLDIHLLREMRLLPVRS